MVVGAIGTDSLLALYDPKVFAGSQKRGRRRQAFVKRGCEATTWPRVAGRKDRAVVSLAARAVPPPSPPPAVLCPKPQTARCSVGPSLLQEPQQQSALPAATPPPPMEPSTPGRDSTSLPDELCLDLMLSHRSVSCLSVRNPPEVRPPVPQRKGSFRAAGRAVQEGGVELQHAAVPCGGSVAVRPVSKQPQQPQQQQQQQCLAPAMPAPPTLQRRPSQGVCFTRSDQHAASAECRRFIASSKALSFLRYPPTFMARETRKMRQGVAEG